MKEWLAQVEALWGEPLSDDDRFYLATLFDQELHSVRGHRKTLSGI